MFIIGNVKDSNTANEISRTVSTPNKNAKIYGVRFDPEFDTHGIPFQPGVGIYDAKDLVCIPSYLDENNNDELVVCQDDFDIPGSPFDIKYVLTHYDAAQNKQVIDEVETNFDDFRGKFGDNITSSGDDTEQLWVRFPKFYYKRPDVYTWLVSSDPVEGFSPSPMHYRNGKMYNYAYVSADYLKTYYKNEEDANNSVYTVGAGLSYNDFWGNTADDTKYFYNGADLALTKDKIVNVSPTGFYLYDYCAHASILMLMLIKYRTFNVHKVLGYRGPVISLSAALTSSVYWGFGIQQYFFSNYEGIKPKETILRNSSGRYNICMGLINFWNTQALLLDGIYLSYSDRSVYITEDIEANKIVGIGTGGISKEDLTNYSHIKKTSLDFISTGTGGTHQYGFQYNDEYPYAFLSTTYKTNIYDKVNIQFNNNVASNKIYPIHVPNYTNGSTQFNNPFCLRHGSYGFIYRGIFFSD